MMGSGTTRKNHVRLNAFHTPNARRLGARKFTNDFAAMRYRRYDHHCCEDLLRVDIRTLRFSPNAPELQYAAMPIAISARENHVRVIHNSLDYFITIEHTRCNYGGSRPWFLCPRCNDRRAVLYSPSNGGQLGCRRCLSLLYESECEDSFGRALVKLRKIERRMCERATGVVGTAPVADKPKGQHWSTYDRRIANLLKARASLVRVWRAQL
jgi:hypothetical protein